MLTKILIIIQLTDDYCAATNKEKQKSWRCYSLRIIQIGVKTGSDNLRLVIA